MSGVWLGTVLGGVVGLWIIYAFSKYRNWKQTALFMVILLSFAAILTVV